jgi:peroxiredoxin Q/BCP
MTDTAISLVGRHVPDFSAPLTGGKTFQLSAYAGRHLVLYFYPKDDTPGCTTEGSDFRHHYPAFQEAQCDIVGVSRDSLKSHENFKAKLEFPFELLSDTDETVCTMFDVMKLKNMYGKQVRSVERSTFVIDKHGVVRAEWRGVKVPGHVDEVLAFVKSLG